MQRWTKYVGHCRYLWSYYLLMPCQGCRLDVTEHVRVGIYWTGKLRYWARGRYAPIFQAQLGVIESTQNLMAIKASKLDAFENLQSRFLPKKLTVKQEVSNLILTQPIN